MVSADYNDNAKHLYRVLKTKDDFTHKIQRTIESMKRSLYPDASDLSETMPVIGNLRNVAFIPDFHVHTSEAESKRLESESIKYSNNGKRQDQWVPDLSQQVQSFSVQNGAGYCVRKDQHANQLPWESDRGSRLTHHMQYLYETDLDFEYKTGPLTWYVELTEGHFHDEENAASRRADLEGVAYRFPATDGPQSLSIYLPHLPDFTTEAEQREYLKSSQARMLEILAEKGADTSTADGKPRIRLACAHNAPRCPDCMGTNRRYVQYDRVRMQ